MIQPIVTGVTFMVTTPILLIAGTVAGYQYISNMMTCSIEEEEIE